MIDEHFVISVSGYVSIFSGRCIPISLSYIYIDYQNDVIDDITVIVIFFSCTIPEKKV